MLRYFKLYIDSTHITFKRNKLFEITNNYKTKRQALLYRLQKYGGSLCLNQT